MAACCVCGTSGRGDAFGLGGMSGICLGANVVVAGLVPGVPGSETIVDCDGVGV